MSGYLRGLGLILPSSRDFTWPPQEFAPPLVPDVKSSAFYISPGFHSAALNPAVPFTIGTVYAATVHFWNGRQRPSEGPYRIAKTKAFYYFVLLHNILLAVYSGWTFISMTKAVAATIPSPLSSSLYPTVHSLCNLAPLWHRKLSFMGFLFYLSKFYEVVDTLIILLKGKRSSTLQTYHHTGAMWAMWAGIRYQSPPIWMFVWINSGIHALMYTYYTLATMGIRVPNQVKRTLTTCQITQFLFGGSFALWHMFVKYWVPETPKIEGPGEAAGWINRLTGQAGKKEAAPVAGPGGEWHPCLKSSGEMYAVVLNVLYLAPLTYLFMAFFVASYTKRGRAAKAAQVNGAANGHTKAIKGTRKS